MQTLHLVAGRATDGSVVKEEVCVRPLGGGSYRLLKSPGLVLGVAADDVLEVDEGGRFSVTARGRNLCVQVFAEDGLAAIERHLTPRLAALRGRLDGKAARELVYTVPVESGFPPLEAALNQAVALFPQAEWLYGNVYDADGVTPLNWWLPGAR